MSRKSQRERLLAVVAENVSHLVQLGSIAAFRKLERIEEHTGYSCNFGTMTNKQLGKAIVAFAGMTTREQLISTAHAAVFYRHLPARRAKKDWNRPNNAWDRADKLADDALRYCGVDVDKRNAKIEAESERIMRQATRTRRASR